MSQVRFSTSLSLRSSCQCSTLRSTQGNICRMFALARTEFARSAGWRSDVSFDSEDEDSNSDEGESEDESTHESNHAIIRSDGIEHIVAIRRRSFQLQHSSADTLAGDESSRNRPKEDLTLSTSSALSSACRSSPSPSLFSRHVVVLQTQAGTHCA